MSGDGNRSGWRGVAGFRRAVDRIDVKVTPALEALLSGRYAEYLERRGDRVPAWAWTNLLAHGTEDALRRATRSRHRPVCEVNVWRRARACLAGEVLDAASRAGSLSSLQAEVLVPLELDLISWVPSRRTCAGEWAARVLAALEDHRHIVPGRRRRVSPYRQRHPRSAPGMITGVWIISLG